MRTDELIREIRSGGGGGGDQLHKRWDASVMNTKVSSAEKTG